MQIITTQICKKNSHKQSIIPMKVDLKDYIIAITGLATIEQNYKCVILTFRNESSYCA